MFTSLKNEDWMLIVTIAAAIVSVAAAWLAWLSAKRDRVVQILTFLHEHYSKLRDWSNEVIDAMSVATYLCDLDPAKTDDPSFFNRWHALRVELSALVDRGRLFFPNTHHDSVGTGKATAYRGLRPAVLDRVIAVLRLVDDMDYRSQAPNLKRRADIVKERREFVSEVQDTLDPRRLEQQMRHLRRSVDLHET